MSHAAASTLVLSEPTTGRMLVCNGDRAKQRFTPASTYKIPHTLLALESGVVIDEHAPFTWDGRSRGVATWDRDTSLAEAIPASTVWVFQTIATQLGHSRERRGVRRLRYGNAAIGPASALRHFWLSGPLAISAVEQVDFLARLGNGTLAADASVQQRTIAMLRRQGCGADCAVYGKTGAMLPIDDDGFLRTGKNDLLPPEAERTGWYVGWVERPQRAGGALYFAFNLDLALPGAMAARTRIVHDVLAVNGIAVDAVP